MTAKEQKLKPSDKQIREFWEGCKVGYTIGVFPSKQYPDLDLNNLFKYAVPKATQELIKRNEGWTESQALKYLFQGWFFEYLWRKSTLEDALFWTIREVIKK